MIVLTQSNQYSTRLTIVIIGNNGQKKTKSKIHRQINALPPLLRVGDER